MTARVRALVEAHASMILQSSILRIVALFDRYREHGLFKAEPSRGCELPTLVLVMAQQTRSAMAVARYLAGNEGHPTHMLSHARRQSTPS